MLNTLDLYQPSDSWMFLVARFSYCSLTSLRAAVRSGLAMSMSTCTCWPWICVCSSTSSYREREREITDCAFWKASVKPYFLVLWSYKQPNFDILSSFCLCKTCHRNARVLCTVARVLLCSWNSTHTVDGFCHLVLLIQTVILLFNCIDNAVMDLHLYDKYDGINRLKQRFSARRSLRQKNP